MVHSLIPGESTLTIAQRWIATWGALAGAAHGRSLGRVCLPLIDAAAKESAGDMEQVRAHARSSIRLEGCALAIGLALVSFSSGCGAGDEPRGAPRAVHGVNARATLISGGTVMLLLGNPLSAAERDASFASVLFYDPTVTGGTCHDRWLDGCRISACHGVDLTLPGTLLSAGDITLTNDAEQVVLTRTSENRYSSGGDFRGGERVRISATGGDLLAFDVEVQIPEPLRVATPAFDQNFDFDVDLRVPLELGWTGGGTSTVELVIMQPGFSGNPLNVVCAFPASQARGTVSPRVLSNLSRDSTAQVTIAAVDGHDVQAGAVDVRIEGVSYPFFGRATFR